MVEESLWFEYLGFWEQGRIVVDEDRGHAYGRRSRDRNFAVLEDCVGEEALEAVGGAVGHSQRFGDGGGEVGEGL